MLVSNCIVICRNIKIKVIIIIFEKYLTFRGCSKSDLWSNKEILKIEIWSNLHFYHLINSKVYKKVHIYRIISHASDYHVWRKSYDSIFYNQWSILDVLGANIENVFCALFVHFILHAFWKFVKVTEFSLQCSHEFVLLKHLREREKNASFMANCQNSSTPLHSFEETSETIGNLARPAAAVADDIIIWGFWEKQGYNSSLCLHSYFMYMLLHATLNFLPWEKKWSFFTSHSSLNSLSFTKLIRFNSTFIFHLHQSCLSFSMIYNLRLILACW